MDDRTLERRLEAKDKLIAELLEALEDAQEHLDYCGWGDKYERDCAREEGLPKKIEEAIRKAKGE